MMRCVVWMIGFMLITLASGQAEVPISQETQACISCHDQINPGLVADWEKSLHAKVTPADALKKEKLQRRVSAQRVPEALSKYVVGCAECHMLSPDKHKDTFDHNGYAVHVIVTPDNCSVCHPEEQQQYQHNKMAHAYGNLVKNPLYKLLADAINGGQTFTEMKTTFQAPDAETEYDSCLFCHGTAVQVKGQQKRQTFMGEMNFPVLNGWPNQGVGRINPDGSAGSCASCHPRHQFAIEVARQPYTCSQCHKGPDVAAYRVYEVSKHGNIFSSLGKSWNFKNVPWKVGQDYTAPTCAACHASLVVNSGGEVVAERTHQMNDRLPWRLFGLIYAHPQPKVPNTTIIRNKADLPLPTELTGEPVAEYLINGKEQEKRTQSFKQVCLSCHGLEWVDNHFRRMENTIQKTNDMTLSATKILMTAWEKGVANGPAQKDSPFNEFIEKKWVEQWLFYANSTRLASAMSGADYGVFAEGRWFLSKNIQEMLDWLHARVKEGRKAPAPKASSKKNP
jgi:hydroxylamine dehydrogenase